MFCSNCGTEIKSKTRFCVKCGCESGEKGIENDSNSSQKIVQTTRSEICLRCKGSGSLVRDRVGAFLKSYGIALLGLLLLVLTEEKISFVFLAIGIFRAFNGKYKLCKACSGTGIVELYSEMQSGHELEN